jgi:mevalonate kinase
MPAFTATSPGKIILFGEHAVVYGEAAIAVPVQSLQARAVVTPLISGKSGEIYVEAPDIDLSSPLLDLDPDHPLRVAISQVLGDHPLEQAPPCRIQISSSIPPASGLGSGAAVSTCLIRALSAFLGQRLDDNQVSRRAFEVEKIHHSTPSGIDNTVIAHQKPIFYRKGEAFRFIDIPVPFSILIANSGKPGDTLRAVQQVRQEWTNDPEVYNQIFSAIGEISTLALKYIESGTTRELGPLMDQNHALLRELGVSTPELDQLVQTARESGALGAKLSGGGLGGHLIALVENQKDQLIKDLITAGAASAFITEVALPN